MKKLLVGVAALLTVAVPPSVACDPETMNELMAELCRSPLEALASAVAGLAPAHDVAPLRAELDRARFACGDGRYEDGLAIALLVSRRVGRLEAGQKAS